MHSRMYISVGTSYKVGRRVQKKNPCVTIDSRCANKLSNDGTKQPSVGCIILLSFERRTLHRNGGLLQETYLDCTCVRCTVHSFCVQQ